MIFLEIIVGAAMAFILLSLGHTLGEAKADKQIIREFNKYEAQLRDEILKELNSQREKSKGLISDDDLKFLRSITKEEER